MSAENSICSGIGCIGGDYENLVNSSPLNKCEKAVIKNALLRGVDPDFYSTQLLDPTKQDKKISKRTLVRTLAIVLTDPNIINRANSVLGLAEARKNSHAQRLMKDIALHYPVLSIRQKALDILNAPEIPAECTSALVAQLSDETYCRSELADPFM